MLRSVCPVRHTIQDRHSKEPFSRSKLGQAAGDGALGETAVCRTPNDGCQGHLCLGRAGCFFPPSIRSPSLGTSSTKWFFLGGGAIWKGPPFPNSLCTSGFLFSFHSLAPAHKTPVGGGTPPLTLTPRWGGAPGPQLHEGDGGVLHHGVGGRVVATPPSAAPPCSSPALPPPPGVLLRRGGA